MEQTQRDPAVVATFADTWQAEFPQAHLTEAGIPAWIESAGPDERFLLSGGRPGPIRLVVPADRVEDARSVLLSAAAWREEDDEYLPRRRPRWIVAACAVLLVALLVASIPPELRWPLVFVTIALYALWRFVRA
jgi:hypothetical protein